MRRLAFWILIYYLSMLSVGYDGALLTGLQVSFITHQTYQS